MERALHWAYGTTRLQKGGKGLTNGACISRTGKPIDTVGDLVEVGDAAHAHLVDEEDDELEQMRNDTGKSQWKISIEKIKEDHDHLAFESKV